jgi:hypothetical protein
MGNQVVKVFSCKQWACVVELPEGVQLKLDAVPEVVSYKLVNLGTFQEQGMDPPELFYRVENGQYGQPLIRPEPTYGLDLPKNLAFRKKNPELGWEYGDFCQPAEKLTGIICHDNTGKVVMRASLTNLQKQGKSYGFQPDGSFLLDGKTWHLEGILNKDKNCFVGGVDGYFREEKPTYVRYAELEDLTF